jgi:acyl-CoA thioester hydrolase
MAMSGTAVTRESTIEFRVRYAETDQMGVVYHSHYLVWCEIGRTDLIRQLGTSYASLEKDGIGLAVIDASVRYHSGAKYDDLVRVRTTVTDVRSRTVKFDYRIETQPPGCASRRPAQRWRRSTGRGNLSRCLPKCESSWKMRAASLAFAGAVMLLGANVARAQGTVSQRNRGAVRSSSGND